LGYGEANGLYGTSGDDTLNGYNVRDTIYGQDGNDVISGNYGDDDLYGGNGDDILSGGDGDDLLDGGLGSNELHGGNGSDTASYDFALTGSGYIAYQDTAGYIKVVDTNNPTEIDIIYTDVETLSFNGTAYTVSALTLGGLGIGEAIDYYGTSSDDTINGYNVSETIYGDAGNDTIYGNYGDDILYGQDGADSLYGGSGADTLSGGDGLDTLTGGADVDTFVLKGETAFNDVDVITDFSNGTGGDLIDIADVLLDYGYDPLTDLLADWVATSVSGSDTLLQVDRDGAGLTYSMDSVAQILGDNFTLTDLTTDGNLIV
jgi:Ca2+-binding RTX toxin-like protein